MGEYRVVGGSSEIIAIRYMYTSTTCVCGSRTLEVYYRTRRNDDARLLCVCCRQQTGYRLIDDQHEGTV